MIDWNRVADLRNEVGNDDFNEVVGLFLEEVGEVIERLRAAKDYSTLEQDLHFLKGGSMNLGFANFSSLCQIGETASAQGRADEVDLTSILESFDASRKMFLESDHMAKSG